MCTLISSGTPLAKQVCLAIYVPNLWDKPRFIESPLLQLITYIKIQSNKLPGPPRALAPAFLTQHGQIFSLCRNICGVDVDMLLILRGSLTSSCFCGSSHWLPIAQAGQLVIFYTAQDVIPHSDLEILETRSLWETLKSSQPCKHRGIVPR